MMLFKFLITALTASPVISAQVTTTIGSYATSAPVSCSTNYTDSFAVVLTVDDLVSIYKLLALIVLTWNNRK
jgi:hypothetical protein